jgi:hypothetical protein
LSRHSITFGLNFIDADVIVGFSAPNLDFEHPEALGRRGPNGVHDRVCFDLSHLNFPLTMPDTMRPALRRDAPYPDPSRL